MNRIKTIIVDDEAEAREGVEMLLQQDPSIEVVAACSNGLQALEAIRSHQPDLLLLDIQMPQVNGFELLNSLSEEERPVVIFITAYDDYTLKAFEVHAVDYLLKPFTDQRFFVALQHAKQHIEHKRLKAANQQLSQLLATQQQKGIGEEGKLIKESRKLINNRLIIKADGRVHLVPLEKIIWVEAYDYYVKIHVKDHTFVVRDSMKSMEETLPAPQFLRIHKSSIINISHIREINPNPQGEYEVTLAGNELLKVSRNYKDRLKGLIG